MSEGYQKFLEAKIELANENAVAIDWQIDDELLFGHQRDSVRWALNRQTALIAAKFGLGKTRIQIAIAKALHARTGQPFLLVCPLGVKHQFVEEDGPAMNVQWEYVRTDAEVEAALERTPFLITNYERVRDGNITPSKHGFCGVSLDEGSVIRSLGSKTHQVFKDAFAHLQYKFVCTATPSPNEFRELIYFADFLGVMDKGQALTRWFRRNPDKAGDLTLMPQHEKDFWLWVASWALFLNKPSDLGYSDDGYSLPPLRVHYHQVATDHTRAFNQTEKDGQRRLIINTAAGVSAATDEKRATMQSRIERMVKIVRPGVFQELLSSEQGKVQRARAGLLSEEQRKDQSAEQEVEGGKSGEIQGSDPPPFHSESGEDQSPKQAVVCEQQSASQRAKSGKKASLVRADSRAIPADGRTTAGEVPYLPETAREVISGSRPSNGQSKGLALQGLQCSTGTVSGELGDSGKSDSVFTQFVIWCELNDEQRAVEKILKEAGDTFSSIFGSLSPEDAETRLYEWKDCRTRILIGKPQMLGSGLNLQQCNQVVFLGVGFKFYQFIQAIHRNWRFLQTKPVDVHIIYSEAEAGIVDLLKQKWALHDQLTERMSDIMQEYGLSHAAIEGGLKRHLGVERIETKGSRYTAVRNDCVDEVKRLADNSIGLIHTSIPFGNHYEYSTNYEDFGHNRTDQDFFAQMDFLIPELYRILKPGRVAAIHVKDRILYGHQTPSGFLEVEEFSDDTVKAFKKHGFLYEGRRVVITDVVRENNSTYRLGWSEMCKDASKMGSGLPEYILQFRKPASSSGKQYADEPIIKDKKEYSRGRWQIDAHNLWRSNGDRPLLPEEFGQLDETAQAMRIHEAEQLTGIYDHERHVAICEAVEFAGKLPSVFMMFPPKVTKADDDPVWDNVNFLGNLNARQVRAGAANHLCPLPFDLCERIIRLYSNEGDIVFDPFGGLGTVPYCAVKLNRIGYSVELAIDYYSASLRYLRDIETQVTTPTLFDLLQQIEAA